MSRDFRPSRATGQPLILPISHLRHLQTAVLPHRRKDRLTPRKSQAYRLDIDVVRLKLESYKYEGKSIPFPASGSGDCLGPSGMAFGKFDGFLKSQFGDGFVKRSRSRRTNSEERGVLIVRRNDEECHATPIFIPHRGDFSPPRGIGFFTKPSSFQPPSYRHGGIERGEPAAL